MKCILKNFPFTFSRQNLIVSLWTGFVHLASPLQLETGGLWSKGRLLIPVLYICGTCCFVLEQASWLLVIEFHFPSILLNCIRKLLFFLL